MVFLFVITRAVALLTWAQTEACEQETYWS